MTMFCHQCQEAAGNKGCQAKGVCGKTADTSNLHDLLVYVLRGYAEVAESIPGLVSQSEAQFVYKALFATITNADFNEQSLMKLIELSLGLRDKKKNELPASPDSCSDAVTWKPTSEAEYATKAASVGIASYSDNEDLRSLKSLLLFGLKGIAAYAEHAAELGCVDDDIAAFQIKALAAIGKDLGADELTGMVLEAGAIAVKTMALLDDGHTKTFGHPEITKVNIGVGGKPGILVSGHDLRDLDELLQQTEGTGVDIYTHCEMLPAHYYPAFKKYDHLVGNYGNSWWLQDKEFASFNGPIILTTNCITPVQDSYKDRIFTTGAAGYPSVQHIPHRSNGEKKDFSKIIELAKTCPPPTELESGEIVGGFAHNQVMAVADKVVEAVKAGAIKRFVVMAGCDGRQAERSYFTEVAENLPKDTIILTAGCAKYRYNKLDLGDIGGIPRVLDAGQCNDSYSLAVIALKLQEVFGLDDINKLPVSFDIAWYEQKAVTVLLALLHLKVKGIRLGPTLPAFLSPGVAKVLVDNFDIKPIGEVQADIDAMMAGQ